MTYKVLLLRLGRIYKPKYDIILYHNWRRISKVGTMYPLKEFPFDGVKIKFLVLNINLITFLLRRGIPFPKWVLSRYKILRSAHRFYSGQVYLSSPLHTALVTGSTVYNDLTQPFSCNTNRNSPLFNFFRGKYLVRHWLRYQNQQKKDLNEKKKDI